MEEQKIEEIKQEESISGKSDVTIDETIKQKTFMQLLFLSLVSGALLLSVVSLREVLPVVGVVIYWIYPIVIASLTYKYGVTMGACTMGVAHCLLYAVWSPTIALSVTLGVGLIGLLFGIGFRKRYQGKNIYLLSLLPYGVMGLLFFILPIPNHGVVYQIIIDLFGWAYAIALGMAEGIMEEGIPLSRDYVAQFFGMILPSLLIVRCLVVVLFYYLLTGFAMKEMGHKVSTMPAFSTWKMPRWYCLSILTITIVSSFFSFEKNLLSLFCANAIAVSVVLFFICGLSLFWHYIRHSQVSVWLKIAVVIFMICISSLSVSAAIVLGMLDGIFDFRKLKKQGPAAPVVSEGEAAVAWEKAAFEKAAQEKTSEDEAATAAVEIGGEPEEKTVDETINVKED
ncbi:MAG: DUF2232 domain-containing protein [Peptococcaceae bacterium]|nr:DUF2232 domain-containing protein [Peptococcaceae bacterium]